MIFDELHELVGDPKGRKRNRWEKKQFFSPRKLAAKNEGEPQKGKESLGPKEKAQIFRGELALSFRECTFFLGEKVGARTKDNVFSAKL